MDRDVSDSTQPALTINEKVDFTNNKALDSTLQEKGKPQTECVYLGVCVCPGTHDHACMRTHVHAHTRTPPCTHACPHVRMCIHRYDSDYPKAKT